MAFWDDEKVDIGYDNGMQPIKVTEKIELGSTLRLAMPGKWQRGKPRYDQ